MEQRRRMLAEATIDDKNMTGSHLQQQHNHHRSKEAGESRQQSKRSQVAPQCGKSQLSSFILFASLIILINLCPFQNDFDETPVAGRDNLPNVANKSPLGGGITEVNYGLDLPITAQQVQQAQNYADSYLSYLQTSWQFVRLMFSQPLRLNKRVLRYTQAEARVLGKMAKVWYIKKKIKKLSKKLKKHTIAVPVFTAIPIYEHSYYPQPHVTHVSHGGMHHAAASSYAPATVAQMAAASNVIPMTPAASNQQQMATSASNQHQVATYSRMSPGHRNYGGGGGGMYHPSASAHHIINAYAPSAPLYVDDTGGLYGHYGNAYGRYDGGYHVW